MIFVYIAEGFEEIEALTQVDVLRRADLEVATVSTESELCVKGAHGVEIVCDMLLEESEKFQADMLVLPGGMPGAMGLAGCKGLLSRIVKEDKRGTLIGAICAAPLVLAKAGILKGRKATIYPGMEDKIEGAEHCKDKVCIDEHIITSQGPATALLFAFSLLAAFSGEEKANAIKKGMLFND